MSKIRFDAGNDYFRKIEELTAVALDKCAGRFLVGYTDLHGGVDCAAAWRDPQQLCMDMIGSPEQVKELIALASESFQPVFDHFDAVLKANGQLSVTWMGIPSYGKMHIPSCDFAAMISTRHFDEFCLPVLAEEVKPMTHNVFHLDGPGVARHLDRILAVPEIHAVQWVQGMGRGTPIMQWLPLIDRIRAAGKSVVIDLQVAELDGLIENTNPEGSIPVHCSKPRDPAGSDQTRGKMADAVMSAEGLCRRTEASDFPIIARDVIKLTCLLNGMRYESGVPTRFEFPHD